MADTKLAAEALQRVRGYGQAQAEAFVRGLQAEELAALARLGKSPFDMGPEVEAVLNRAADRVLGEFSELPTAEVTDEHVAELLQHRVMGHAEIMDAIAVEPEAAAQPEPVLPAEVVTEPTLSTDSPATGGAPGDTPA